MKLTKKAQTAKAVLEELKQVMRDKLHDGTEGMTNSQELWDYTNVCCNIINSVNTVTDQIDIYFKQEEIDKFYLEQHTNQERLEYTMKSIIISYFPQGGASKYINFIELFIDGFQDAFNFMDAENAGAKAREEGSTFRKGYALNTLDQLIDMCIARINYSDAQCEQLIYNATALKLFSEILKEI